MLESVGYRTTIAADGKQALTAAERRKPSLIITDIAMPEMGGMELCREIKSRKSLKGIPVIVLTILTSIQNIIDALANGAENFIRKPYDRDYLLSRVTYLLSTPEVREERKKQVGVELSIRGQRHFITVERQQIADLLIASYEEVLGLNEELQAKQRELMALANQLEKKVAKGTSDLRQESAERKRAEERVRVSEAQLRLVVEAAKDFGIFMLDPSGRIANWNAGAERLYGYGAGQIVGQPWSCLYPHEAAERGEPEQDLRAASEGVCEKETRLMRQDGSPFWADMAMSYIGEEGGKERGFSIVVRDITERRRLEQERELQSLEGISPPAATTVTSRIFGERPLSESVPEAFQTAVERYAQLLDGAVARRTYKSAPPQGEGLQDFSQELGFLRATPRDIIDIHSSALRGRVVGAPEGKTQVYMDEGRLVALETMGRLAGFYRKFYPGSGQVA